ncbi:isoleucine--tRNA ligase, partial [bacterium]|nr:isoleucine--tRNA ligase [bacterium]
WDCHGLPIELKVSQKFPGLSRVELKKKCRIYAQKWVDIQKEEFKALGVLMDWNHPYLTMNPKYEASILRSFGTFVAGGYIERKNKTVPWCFSCQTVLASAEIEHKERKDPSIYVEFPLSISTAQNIFPKIKKPISLLIWTTTPWTLPLNRAVTLKPKSEYVILNIKDKLVIVGKKLADTVCSTMKVTKVVITEFNSDQLINAQVHHPFVVDLKVPIIFDPFVSLQDGTACVHSAPGCGPEDYELGIKNGLEIFSPLGPDGKYTEGIAPKELEGMPIRDGQIWVLRKLIELDKLLHKTSIRHPYPHCWRCANGLMFRATKQWFCDLAKGDLKKKALLACETIQALPPKTINRLKATVESRLEWCLSRQRVWGVPIPALLCNDCETPYISKELIQKVAAKVEQQGIEYWDTVALEELVAKDFSCNNCQSTNFRKETDILDVWFDSGVSHQAVLKRREHLGLPADMYIEGKDQHRGWFQSSLLTGLVLEKMAPFKTLITHGFTVDKTGRKMSKSLGNVVAPQEIINKLGTDGLRLWASSIDIQGDAIVSDVLVKNVQEVFRKVRNTCRFLLSNLYDFDIQKDAVDLDALLPIDRYALEQMCRINEEVIDLYKQYDFTAVFHKFADYVTVDLSSFYLDIVKDRLYVEKADGLKRRSTQTVFWYLLDTLTKLIAPILSFNAEQLSDHYQKNKKESVHLQRFADLKPIYEQLARQYASYPTSIPTKFDASAFENLELKNAFVRKENMWVTLKEVRSAILKAIELKREKNIIKHPLEAAVTVYFDIKHENVAPLVEFYEQLKHSGQDATDFLKEFLIVSQFTIAQKSEGLEQSEFPGMHVSIERVSGAKCPRCWHWSTNKQEHNLCARCENIIK